MGLDSKNSSWPLVFRHKLTEMWPYQYFPGFKIYALSLKVVNEDQLAIMNVGVLYIWTWWIGLFWCWAECNFNLTLSSKSLMRRIRCSGGDLEVFSAYLSRQHADYFSDVVNDTGFQISTKPKSDSLMNGYIWALHTFECVHLKYLNHADVQQRNAGVCWQTIIFSTLLGYVSCTW